MDEELLDLLDMALAERFQLSYASMRQEQPQTEKLITRLIEISEAIQNSPTILQEDKKLIDEYLSVNTEVEAKTQQYLYIQGAKDCVTVLRELGVIK
ncbi:hypothetical protein [Hydrogenoanaerobacterium sp.]|uniref:hypothetical protein n=1 Tax=Hydrogenoanaerobacterium sp. TaxID=2953763 RepID=UPI00289FE241|nr:hypothetical protein [Hydrogenoanaerobacterium sp.]